MAAERTDRLRHRDLLLSLKYSTIEACFSVPMLNLTLPSFPFVIAFAVKVLGWKAAAVGLMTALPHLCNCLQPLFLPVLTRRLSIYQIVVIGFLLSAMPWGFVSMMPWLGAHQNATFAAILIVATLGNSMASIAWSTAISEVVPARIAGKYFGRRNLMFGVWTLIAVLVAGYCVDRGGNTLSVFGWVFATAGLARMLGLFFMSRMKFPPSVTEVRAVGQASFAWRGVFANANYMRLAVFIGVWGLLLNASLPFYTVYLMNRLGFGVGEVVKLTTLSSLGALLTLKAWGRLCDQFGSRPVLHVCAIVWSVTAIAMWSFASPDFFWHLNIGYLVIGAMTAGFQLSQFNLMVKLSPSEHRSAHLATFAAITSLLTAIGPMLGGWILSMLPGMVGQIAGQPITRFHLLFVVTMVGGLIATNLAGQIHEPAQQPVENLWRAMRRMRTFNPMLSVMSAGQLLLTPRGLVALARRSLRTARRQVRAIGDVGEEIVEGGRDVVRKRLTRD